MLERISENLPGVARNSDFERFIHDIFYRLPANTQKAYRSDWNSYLLYCKERSIFPVATTIDDARSDLRGYATWLIDSNFARATVDRRLHTVTTLLQLLGAPNPMDVLFKKELKLIKRGTLSKRQQQAVPLMASELAVINAAWGNGSLKQVRDCLLLNMAFDTMCRCSELTKLLIEDVKVYGSVGTALVRKSKTDQEGVGSGRFVSGTTLSLLNRYKEIVGLSEGFIFQPLTRQQPDNHVGYDVVSDAFRLAGSLVGGKRYTTHSARVGATQEQIRAKTSLAKIMQAGGWTTAEMVARYGRELNALDAGMAELSEQLGR